MRVAVIGNLTRDVVDGGPPRVGGAPFHAARALRLLGGRAAIVARCSAADRPTLLPPLVALGVPVRWIEARSTTGFTLRYEGERRTLEIDALGEPWTQSDIGAVERATWVQVGSLSRADFPPDVLAALARERRLALDAQGLVRAGKTGPVELDGDFDETVLRHVTVLKVAEDEAEALGGEERLLALGVPKCCSPRARRARSCSPTAAGSRFPSGESTATSIRQAPATASWLRTSGLAPPATGRSRPRGMPAATAARMLELTRASVVSTQDP